MARPRMDDMRANLVPGSAAGVCGRQPLCSPAAGTVVHPWSARGGNPQLEPWRAKELDIGYEWYGGKASYFASTASTCGSTTISTPRLSPSTSRA